jgi:magnesium-transporting ATPase (P-type)
MIKKIIQLAGLITFVLLITFFTCAGDNCPGTFNYNFIFLLIIITPPYIAIMFALNIGKEKSIGNTNKIVKNSNFISSIYFIFVFFVVIFIILFLGYGLSIHRSGETFLDWVGLF